MSQILQLGFRKEFFVLERGNSSCNEQQVQGLCTLCCTNSLLGNHHLVVVERFVCSYEPGGYVVWGLVHLVGSLKGNWSQVRGQTKNVSKKPGDCVGGRALQVRSGGAQFHAQRLQQEANAWIGVLLGVVPLRWISSR